MSVIDTLLGTIDEAIRGTGEGRRHALLARATDLLIEHVHDLTDHHISVFDEVILSLIGDVESMHRAALAERLADLTRAPKKTTRGLALDDDIVVARPVIERSPCLDDDTLITIVRERDPEFLSLVAKRRSLPVPVIEHVVERADDHLVVDLVRNEMTPISDSALRRLAERALRDQTLYRILRSRPDLALRHIGAVIEAARHRAHSDASARMLDDDILSRALAVETAKSIARASTLALSAKTNSGLSRDGADRDLNALLERHQIDDALDALAAQAGTSPDMIKRAFQAPQYEPLMFVLRAQDYPLPTLLNFMRHKHGGMSQAFEAQMSEAYCTLARDTAKRLAQFIVDTKASAPSIADEQEPLRHSA